MRSSNYWKKAARIGRQVFNNRQVANVDEQAGPAYFEGLGLSRWLFWRRLKMSLQEVAHMRGKVAVDFGCGFGLALPQLREQFDLTVGVDLMPELSTDFLRRWDEEGDERHGTIRVVKSLDEVRSVAGSVDLILALDVLEHFETVSPVLLQLHSLLSPSGVLLVSGPTENFCYRIGRKLVGFSGAYHHQTVYQVMDAMSTLFDIQHIRRLPQPAPLFVICAATKKAGDQNSG